MEKNKKLKLKLGVLNGGKNFFSLVFLSGIVAVLVFAQNGRLVVAATYPAQVLDLTNWKETLPTGPSGSPTEIKQASLATYSADPYFKVDADSDGVVFRAPVNGVTTSGSGYPRSELREMTNGGKTNASWSTNSGTHTMLIDEAITAVPATKKHVVAGQVHDAKDDVIVIRLEYPKLFVDINGVTGPTLDANYVLGKRFTVMFVASKGQIRIYYNGGQTPAYTLNKISSGDYFKAGAYTQSNCSKEKTCASSNFGEVVIYKLLVKHQTSTVDAAVPVISQIDSALPSSPAVPPIASAPAPASVAPALALAPAPTPGVTPVSRLRSHPILLPLLILSPVAYLVRRKFRR